MPISGFEGLYVHPGICETDPTESGGDAPAMPGRPLYAPDWSVSLHHRQGQEDYPVPGDHQTSGKKELKKIRNILLAF